MNLINKVKNHIGGFNEIVLIIYTTAVISTHFFIDGSMLSILRDVFLVFFFSLFICPKVLNYTGKKCKKLSIYNDKNIVSESKKQNTIIYALPFVLLFLQFIAYFPGGFSGDTFKQLSEAYTNTYDDWFPVFHTLFAFKLPFIFTGGKIVSSTVFQIILFSLAVDYTFYVLKKHVNYNAALIILLYIIINPQTLNIVMFPMKDVAFAIGALVLTDFSLEIIITDGKWIKKAPNLIAFIAVIICTTLFRHNAILFTAPFLIALICCYLPKKHAFIICISVVVLLCGIKVPVYNAMNVTKPENRQTEILGLPMSVIGAVAAKTPERLDKETKEFVYSVAPQSVWEKDFTYLGFNSIKFEETTNKDAIDKYGSKNVLKTMFKCIQRSPSVALKEIVILTNPTYSILNDTIFSLKDNKAYFTYPDVYKNEYGLIQSGIPALKNLSRLYTEICILFLPYLFFSLGSLHLLLLIVYLSVSKNRKKANIKNLLLVLPLFIYNFGTMLLLTGSQDTIRFFYYTYLVVPILLVTLLKKIKCN